MGKVDNKLSKLLLMLSINQVINPSAATKTAVVAIAQRQPLSESTARLVEQRRWSEASQSARRTRQTRGIRSGKVVARLGLPIREYTVRSTPKDARGHPYTHQRAGGNNKGKVVCLRGGQGLAVPKVFGLRQNRRSPRGFSSILATSLFGAICCP